MRIVFEYALDLQFELRRYNQALARSSSLGGAVTAAAAAAVGIIVDNNDCGVRLIVFRALGS